MRHQLIPTTKIAAAILGVAGLSVTTVPTSAEAHPTKKVTASAKARVKASAPGRPMKASELRRLYSGKTWVWANGGGYMDPSGRFVGLAGKGYTRGTWRTAGNGRMCFGGVWTTGKKRNRGQTCFAHRVRGDTIYQRKGSKGTWYTFKHSPVRGADEYSKLAEGDRVSGRLRQVQAALASR